MGVKLGFEAKLYVDDEASYASPTWVEVKNCKDLTLNLERAEANVTTRGNNGWEAIIGALKTGSIDFSMVYDTDDANFQTFKNAFLDNTPINVAAVDGNIATAGTEGFRAMMTVLKFTKNEQLTEAQTVDVSIKPTYFPADAPEWLVIP